MSDNIASVFSSNDSSVRVRRSRFDPNSHEIFLRMTDESPIQGDFLVVAQAEIELRHLEPRHRVRLATLFLELQEQGQVPDEITVELIEEARSRQPTPVIDRAERLLRFLHDETVEVGQRLRYQSSDVRPQLHSESVSANEVIFLLNFLEEQGLVDNGHTLGHLGVTLTVEGFAHIAKQATAPDSSQAFVAMWFHQSMDALYSDGIAPGVENAGYGPLRVDREPTLHRIDDQIIAEIRRSRFMVADFTQGDGGARGSVYYEAGFAHGLGLPVIFTCRQDQIDQLHFDTRQYPHIGWTEPADLRAPLQHRIEALIGRGEAAATG